METSATLPLMTLCEDVPLDSIQIVGREICPPPVILISHERGSELNFTFALARLLSHDGHIELVDNGIILAQGRQPERGPGAYVASHILINSTLMFNPKDMYSICIFTNFKTHVLTSPFSLRLEIANLDVYQVQNRLGTMMHFDSLIWELIRTKMLILEEKSVSQKRKESRKKKKPLKNA